MKRKNKILSLITLIISGSSLFAQMPTMITESNNSNKYSNDQIATNINEIISAKLYKKITGNEKTEKDLIIILKNNGQLSSYDFQTLEHKWDLIFSDSSYNKMRNHFKVENSILYTTSTQRELLAINVNNGEKYWKTQIGQNNKVSKRYMINGQHLPIKGSLIYLASNNKQLYAFNKLNGSITWNYKLDFPFNNYSPVINNNQLVISNAPWIYCFEARTGKAIWQRGFGNVPMYSNLQIDNEKVYTASEGNKIYSLNINNNAAIDWEIETENNHPRIGENTILGDNVYYFGAKNDKGSTTITAINTANGEKIWQSNLKNLGTEINVFCKYNNYILGFTNAQENSFFLINSITGEEVEVKSPKENALSNIFNIEDKLVFISKNYLTTFNLKEKEFSYRDLKLDYEVNDDFNLYFEIIQKKK
ncbi:outer membrane protein assembly factor BamB [Flavobacterium sp. 7E]|uniref:outer membrane protein assembly factor BamB family protein n=1 Tax=Flavobacterium sp. 7E TaxID=2735898 RepID=UPI00156E61BF|nr:PQQ-binding-like beta-propeller repeat protein [Flavobacterium sp. 7E]NRS90363.1 outer membrane protein assembly factor BamB [Flavobacterium sp. 7E]